MPHTVYEKTVYESEAQNYSYYHKMNAAHLLILDNQLEAFKVLIQHDKSYLSGIAAKLNHTTINYAYALGKMDFVDAILEYPASPNDPEGYGALVYNILSRSKDKTLEDTDLNLLKKLINKGANNFYYNSSSVLHLLVELNHPELIELLLQERSDLSPLNNIYQVNQARETFIRSAITLGRNECLNVFITIKNKSDDTLLDFLIKNNQGVINNDIAILLDYFFLQHNQGDKELFVALATPSPISQRNQKYLQKLFHLSKEYHADEGYITVVKELLHDKLKKRSLIASDAIFLVNLTERNVNLAEIKDEDGHTLMHQLVYPLKAINRQAIQSLIESGCIPVNTQNAYKQTILDCYMSNPAEMTLDKTNFLLKCFLPAKFKETTASRPYNKEELSEISKKLMPNDPRKFRTIALDALFSAVNALKILGGPQHDEKIVYLLESALNDEVFKQHAKIGAFFRGDKDTGPITEIKRVLQLHNEGVVDNKKIIKGL